MRTVEELFDLSKDPLELKNRAATPEYREVLSAMQKAYDRELAAWIELAEEKYKVYGTLFDRNIPSVTKLERSAKDKAKKTKKKKP